MGQSIDVIKAKRLAEKQDGWLIVLGKVDKASWGLLVFFAIMIGLLSLSATDRGS